MMARWSDRGTGLEERRQNNYYYYYLNQWNGKNKNEHNYED